MKVAFVCTGNSFTTSMLYKENYFIKASVKKGYETLVVASQYSYVDGKKVLVSTSDSNVDGYRLVRLPYKMILNSEFITEKVRNTIGLTDLLISFKPDFIFYNCPQIYNIKELRRLKYCLPKVRVVLDFSTKYINSARNTLSKYILHRGFYRNWLNIAASYVDCITYVSSDTLDFILNEYKLNKNKMVEIGLPGEIISRNKREIYRKEIRDKYNVKNKDILYVHSGKIGKQKKTIELLRCFSNIKNNSFKLIIAGSIENEVKEQIEKLIKLDNRVHYIGFVTGEYLTKLLCACDMYLQPGTISQTSQTAICCGAPIMFMDCPTNKELFMDNGYLLNSLDEMESVFRKIESNYEILEDMKKKSLNLAYSKLDYKKLFDKTLEYSGINFN